MSELESVTQQRLIETLRRQGWMVVKNNLCSVPGFPDLTAIRGGRVVFVEVKRPNGRTRPLQDHVHKQIREHGGVVVTYDGGILPKELKDEED